MKPIDFSPLESNRFNLNIYRGQIDEFNVEELKSIIFSNQIDILMVRMHSSSKPAHYELTTLGFNCLHADSLVYYSANLTSHAISAIKNDLTFEIITEANSGPMKEMIPEIFKDYQNHYFSNPFLDKEKITAGYLEFALSHTRLTNNKISWYVKKNDIIAGFATCSFSKETKECVGVLYGIMPGFSGQKIYSDMMRFTQSYFSNLGLKRMIVSTQLQNYAVQRNWVREGFSLVDSYETYHINAFLQHPLSLL